MTIVKVMVMCLHQQQVILSSQYSYMAYVLLTDMKCLCACFCCDQMLVCTVTFDVI